MRLPRSARTSLVIAGALVPALLLGSPAYAEADVTYSTLTGFGTTVSVTRQATQTVSIQNDSLTEVTFIGVGTQQLTQKAAPGAVAFFTMSLDSGAIAAVGAGAVPVLVIQ